MKNNKLIFFLALFIIGIIAILILNISQEKQSGNSAQNEPTKQTVPETDPPQIISTKPNPLEEAIVAANQEVEITFNRSLENVGEFKVRIEPKVDFKVELSADRKTAKIIPTKPYELGTTYTLFIGTETKFDGVGRWGEEKIFHFRTIKYRGI